MDFWDRMKGAIDKGVDSSRDLFGRAREKAKGLGERGVVRFEIMQLESQAEKLVAKLGSLTFEQLADDPNATVARTSPGISALLEEIKEVRARITEKEAALRAMNETPGDESEKP